MRLISYCFSISYILCKDVTTAYVLFRAIEIVMGDKSLEKEIAHQVMSCILEQVKPSCLYGGHGKHLRAMLWGPHCGQ